MPPGLTLAPQPCGHLAEPLGSPAAVRSWRYVRLGLAVPAQDARGRLGRAEPSVGPSCYPEDRGRQGGMAQETSTEGKVGRQRDGGLWAMAAPAELLEI